MTSPWKTILIGGFALAISSAAAATPWLEIGDAGSLPGTAQITIGGGPLTIISGNIFSSSDEDMYLINISNPAAFSATTVGTGGTAFDTQLFLFDSTGLGVYTNDDAVGLRSTLPAAHALGPALPGQYYLAISTFDNDPVSGAGLIFPNTFPGVFGPTGPGGAAPITGWAGAGSTGTYNIHLTGANFGVPVPGTVLLVATGLLGVGTLRRRRRS